jgi:hypothetical protein
MRTITATIGFLVLLSFASRSGLAAEPQPGRQILGLRLNMNGEQAHARLKEIGSFVRAVEPRQEVWKVRDPSYANILLGFNKDGKLRYITAVARGDKEAQPVSYSSIGDLKKAKNAGNPKMKLYNYQWDLPAGPDEPHALVIAIGRDPSKLSTYSLKRFDNNIAAEKDDD